MYTSKNPSVQVLLDRLKNIHQWNRIGFLLGWDQETQMPKSAANLRAADMSFVSGNIHKAFVALNDDNALANLVKNKHDLSKEDQVVVCEVNKACQLHQKLPLDFVKELSETSSKAMMAWQNARSKNDPKLFLPLLQKMIDLTRQSAEYHGYVDSPYDALLNEYEPKMTTARLDTVFAEVKNFTVPLVKKLNQAGACTRSDVKHKAIPVVLQKVLNDKIAKMVGFDFDRGATAISAHPFSSGAFSGDIRFTSRYDQHNVLYAIGSTLHEVGHGLYEQGLPLKFTGTPLAEAVSLGIHESQSRFYENYIGRSFVFAQYLSKTIQDDLGATLSAQQIFDYCNAVKPSLIRVEADELTYNLHIIIRYEIEKMIFEEGLDAHQIEDVWNAKYKQYLGVTVDTPANGFLQDVHWSMGGFGYFATYTLGNLYSAQFANTLSKTINIDDAVKNQNYTSILNWLNTNVHQHGQRYSAAQLVQNITGEPLNTKYLKHKLEQKVENILKGK